MIGMASYHLEILESLPCSNEKLEIFGRAFDSYINQIFGDQTVRDVIQEYKRRKGRLMFEKSGAEFGHSFHHFYQSNEKSISKVCSVDERYQDIKVDINDNLCQSYSLMTYLGIPFDKTPSKKASSKIKQGRQMKMIKMYRDFLDDDEFMKIFAYEFIHKKNDRKWKDTVDKDNKFFIVKVYRTADKIVKNIRRVLDVWERYGWMFFVRKGECIKGSGSTRKRSRSVSSQDTPKSLGRRNTRLRAAV